MDFYLETQEGEPQRMVISASAYSYRNGLQIYWGISNFGFGDFSFLCQRWRNFLS